MSWKNLSYWLRGGIIGIIIFLVILVIALVFGRWSSIGGWSYFLIYFPTTLISVALTSPGQGAYFIGFLGSIIISLIFYFLLGSLIGFLFERPKKKIKSKSKGVK